MLLGEDRRRYQKDHLLRVLDCLEGGPESDLRFAVSHVSADQPVHDTAGFHIRFHGRNGAQLVLCFLIGKQLFEFLLPDGILAVTVALCMQPFGIQLDELLRDIIDSLGDPGPCLLPLGAVQLVQLRLHGAAVGVFLDQIQFCGGKV